MALLENEVGLVKKLSERIKEEQEKKKAKVTILDIGCGTGKLALYLKEAIGGDVTGIDPGRESIEKARKQSSSVTFEVQLAEETAFANNTFDLVVSLKALHEMDNPAKVLRESHRLLNVDGWVFIIDWIGSNAKTGGHAHAGRYFTPERLEEALLEAGFANITIERNDKWGLMLAEGVKVSA